MHTLVRTQHLEHQGFGVGATTYERRRVAVIQAQAFVGAEVCQHTGVDALLADTGVLLAVDEAVAHAAARASSTRRIRTIVRYTLWMSSSAAG